MHHLDADPRGDLSLGIAHRHVDATKGRPASGLDEGARMLDSRFLGSDLDRLRGARAASLSTWRVAVLARALFLSMNSWRCFFFASTPALTRSSCLRRSF